MKFCPKCEIRLKETDQNQLDIKPHKNLTFTIRDCGRGETQFESFSNDSSIRINKHEPAQYEITQGKLLHT